MNFLSNEAVNLAFVTANRISAKTTGSETKCLLYRARVCAVL